MSELSQAIQEMRNMRESYDQIGAAAEAYNTGKKQLAQNISAKGVPASEAETLPELAGKVAQIAQTETVIDGGDMYAAQLTGDGALWNLYAVLADMKSRFMGTDQYACLIVCEYYKGYDSLQLQGADGYYTCDGDFYDVSSPLHTWHDSDNGKANRWVCFLFATDGARLDITNTAISPRSMYIGGHIGTIEYFVDGRLTDIVSGIEETDVVDLFVTKGDQSFGINCILRGIKNLGSYFRVKSDGLVALGVERVVSDTQSGYYFPNASQVSLPNAKNIISRFLTFACKKVTSFIAPEVEAVSVTDWNFFADQMPNLLFIDFSKLKSWVGNAPGVGNSTKLANVIVGEMFTNLPIPTWNPTDVLADATKKAQLIDNIKNHILARVSDATGGTQLVFTVSTNMYNAIASETITWNDQTMTLADAFLTKNWLLAGA